MLQRMRRVDGDKCGHIKRLAGTLNEICTPAGERLDLRDESLCSAGKPYWEAKYRRSGYFERQASVQEQLVHTLADVLSIINNQRITGDPIYGGAASIEIRSWLSYYMV